MSFIETPRFPLGVRFGMAGGPSYSTAVATMQSGWESRNQNWALPRGQWVAQYGPYDQATTDTLVAYFHSMRGKAHGFRFRDPSDYLVTVANGILDAGVGDGTPTYQLGKTYTTGSLTQTRTIRKPVSGQVAVYRNAGAVTVGVAAGNIAIDTTTGTITFVADASSAATAITVGATTQVTLTTNPGPLVAGKLLYLAGFTGADAALVNGIAHAINSVTGTGPYIFTLATVTTGKTITLGSGNGYKYPQASDVLTWSGQFDVPVRFDVDQLNIVAIESSPSNPLFSWNDIKIIEIRT